MIDWLLLVMESKSFPTTVWSPTISLLQWYFFHSVHPLGNETGFYSWTLPFLEAQKRVICFWYLLISCDIWWYLMIFALWSFPKWGGVAANHPNSTCFVLKHLGIPEVPSTSCFTDFSHEVSDEDALARIKEEDWEVIEVRSEGLQDWRYEEQHGMLSW